MLTQYDFQLDTEGTLNYRMSSLFHGALMECFPEEAAVYFHQSQMHPYSQHLEQRDGKWHWIISSLNKEMKQLIENGLLDRSQILLKKPGLTIDLKEPQVLEQSEEDLKTIFYNGNEDRYFPLRFMTPTSFKRQGQYLIYPDLFCLFQSLMMRYDVIFENGMTDQDTLEELVSQSSILHYRLNSTYFHLEGVRVPSFLGTITIKMKGTATMRRLARMLLTFGQYSGVGIKTSIGMGAVMIEQPATQHNEEEI